MYQVKEQVHNCENPEGKKCGQEICVGTKAQAQSPSYQTSQCNRE